LWESIVSGFTQLLQYFYLLTEYLKIPNYGLAIIFFTLAVKSVLFPLTAKQMRSMRVIQELQPKIKAIQEKYRDKPEKAQQAVMNLYKEAGANPLSGCLPLLVQMPILFALYQALLHFPFSVVEHTRFLWIPNLAHPDLIGLPVLVVITTFFQQYVTSLTTTGKIDSNQRMMLYFMPLVIGWLARSFPAGLSLYWVTFSFLGIIEQFIIKRYVRIGREQSVSNEVGRSRG